MVLSFPSAIASLILFTCIVRSCPNPSEWRSASGHGGVGHPRKYRTCTYRPKHHPPSFTNIGDPNPVQPVSTVSAESAPVPTETDCVHGPYSRHCWDGDFSIDTDMDLSWPDTGKIVKARLHHFHPRPSTAPYHAWIRRGPCCLINRGRRCYRDIFRAQRYSNSQ
jgi:hypothetical protein